MIMPKIQPLREILIPLAYAAGRIGLPPRHEPSHRETKAGQHSSQELAYRPGPASAASLRFNSSTSAEVTSMPRFRIFLIIP